VPLFDFEVPERTLGKWCRNFKSAALVDHRRRRSRIGWVSAEARCSTRLLRSPTDDETVMQPAGQSGEHALKIKRQQRARPEQAMAKMGILQAGNPILRQAAKEVPRDLIDSSTLQDLIEIMVTTMRDAPGVGLAAPQIGVPLRIIVLEDTERLMRFLTQREKEERGRVPFPLQVLINPVLRPLSGETASFYEGCLSVAGYEAEVARHLRVEVEGLDRDGTGKSWQASGWPARILQHEIDHLNGKLYVDAMTPRTFSARPEREQQNLHDVLATLGIHPK